MSDNWSMINVISLLPLIICFFSFFNFHRKIFDLTQVRGQARKSVNEIITSRYSDYIFDMDLFHRLGLDKISIFNHI